MWRETKQKVLDKIDFRKFYSQYVSVPADQEIQQVDVLCCFHDDTRPSLSLNLQTGEFHCKSASCVANDGGGSIFDFYMLQYQCSFSQALSAMAESVGVSVPTKQEQNPAILDDLLVEGYMTLLEKNQKQLQFLINYTGWSRETLERFQIGFDGERFTIPIYDEGGHCVNIRRYLPGGKPKVLSFGRGYGKTRLFPLLALLNADAVLLTEGERDCITAWQIGFNDQNEIVAITSTGGAGSWRKNWNKYFKGKRVFICYDTDEDGRKGAHKAAQSLSEAAKEVKIVHLPTDFPGKDLSDFILHDHTKEDVEVLLESAEGVPQPNEPTLTVVNDQDPSRFFEGRVFIPRRLSNEIMSEQSFIHAAERLWIYEDGVFLPTGEDVIYRLGREKMGEAFRQNRIREVTFDIQVATMTESDLLNKHTHLINLANGMLDINTLTLKSHSPKYLSTVRVPIHYDPEAMCPGIDKFLTEVLPADSIGLAWQILGYLFVPTTKYQRAFLLVGTGSNGKGTFIELVIRALGKDNVSNVSLQDICVHRFKRAELYGKLANILADLDALPLESTGYFKMITAGDMIDAERKHQDPFSFRPYSRLIYSANEIPRASDHTFAYYRRWIIVPFPNTFTNIIGNERVELVNELATETELSGMLNRACSGWRRLEKQKGFRQTPTTQQALDRYRLENDNVEMFVKYCCEFQLGNPDYYERRMDVYQLYTSFCRDNGLHALSQIRFVREMQRLGFSKARLGKERTKIWVGLRLIVTQMDDLVI